MATIKRIPDNARVRKINSSAVPGSETHQDGALATVVMSIGPITEEEARKLNDPSLTGHYGYCVHWDDLPSVPVWIIGTRLEEVKVN